MGQASSRVLAWAVAAWLSRLLWPALLIGALPFVVLCFCCFPVADDYVLAVSLHQHGLFGAQAEWYREWTGKYSGILGTSFFMHFVGLERYWLCPLALLVLTLLVAWLVVRRLAAVRGRPALLAAAMLAVFFLARIRSPAETLYFVTAAIEYQGANLAAILLLALVMRRPVGRSARRVHLVLAALVALVVVGTTETMMFAMVLAAATGLLLCGLGRRWPSQLQAVVSVAIFAGAAFMALSPGNAARSSLFPAAHQLVPSLLSATTHGCEHVLRWTAQPALWGLTFLFLRAAPTIARQVLSGVRPGRVLPLLWLVGIVCAGHFPAFWAMGMKAPQRAIGNIQVAFLAGWFVLVLPFVAHTVRRLGGDPRSQRMVTLGRALVVVGLFVPSNVPRALTDVALGGAAGHRREQVARAAAVAEAKRLGVRDVVVAPLVYRPKTIWFDDLTADPTDWRNTSYATWHGIGSVRVAASAQR